LGARSREACWILCLGVLLSCDNGHGPFRPRVGRAALPPRTLCMNIPTPRMASHNGVPCVLRRRRRTDMTSAFRTPLPPSPSLHLHSSHDSPCRVRPCFAVFVVYFVCSAVLPPLHPHTQAKESTLYLRMRECEFNAMQTLNDKCLSCIVRTWIYVIYVTAANMITCTY